FAEFGRNHHAVDAGGCRHGTARRGDLLRQRRRRKKARHKGERGRSKDSGAPRGSAVEATIHDFLPKPRLVFGRIFTEWQCWGARDSLSIKSVYNTDDL